MSQKNWRGSQLKLLQETREWLTLGCSGLSLLAALVAVAISFFAYKVAKEGQDLIAQQQEKATVIETSRALAEAWALFGGQPGAPSIEIVVRDRPKLGQAMLKIREALTLDPDNARAHRYWAIYLASMNKFDASISKYQEAIRLAKKEGDLVEMARSFNGLGYIYTDKEKYDDAATAFQSAIDHEPAESIYYYNLATTLSSLGRLEESIQQFEKALSHDPRYWPAHFNKANALYDLKRMDKCIESYLAAIQAGADAADVYYNLGLALDQIGEPRKAIAAYQRAISIDPEYSAAYSNLSNVLKELGDRNGSKEALKKAKEIRDAENLLAPMSKPDIADG